MRYFLLCLLLFSTGLTVCSADLLTENEIDFVALPAVQAWLKLEVKQQGNTLTLQRHDGTVRLTIGQPLAVIGDKPTILSAVPMLRNNVVFLPAPLLTKRYGVQFDWDIDGVSAMLTAPGVTKPLMLQRDLQGSMVQENFRALFFHGNILLVKKYLNRYPALLTMSLEESYPLTPLDLAISKDDLSLVRFLIDQGAKFPTGDQQQDARLLFGAMRKDSTEMLDFLLSRGCKVDSSLADGMTPLIAACSSGAYKAVVRLIERGANVNAVAASSELLDMENRDLAVVGTDEKYFNLAENSTPLTVAISFGETDIVKYLLAHGADPNVVLTPAKFTVMHVAAAAGQGDFCALLAEHGAKIEVTSTAGLTPLHLACIKGNARTVAWLLNHKANPEATVAIVDQVLSLPRAQAERLPYFGTPLMFAAFRGNDDIMQVFSERNIARPTDAQIDSLNAAFSTHRNNNKINKCINNLKQLSTLALMFAQEHNEVLPDKEQIWKLPGIENIDLRCPNAVKQTNGYGYNINLSRLSLGDIPDPSGTIAFADSNSADGLVHSPADIDYTRHGNGYCAVFCDGHVEFIHPAKLELTPRNR